MDAHSTFAHHAIQRREKRPIRTTEAVHAASFRDLSEVSERSIQRVSPSAHRVRFLSRPLTYRPTMTVEITAAVGQN